MKKATFLSRLSDAILIYFARLMRYAALQAKNSVLKRALEL